MKEKELIKAIKIGVTGCSGSGSSTFTSFLPKPPFDCLSADQISLEVSSSEKVLNAVEKAFGREYVNYEEPGLERKKLGSLVFSDSEKLKLLESILHPEIFLQTMNWLTQKRASKYLYLIYDAPLIFEKNLKYFYGLDLIVTVNSDHKTRMERIKTRDAISEEDYESRISNQWELSRKCSESDYVIENNKDLGNLKEEAEAFILWLEEREL